MLYKTIFWILFWRTLATRIGNTQNVVESLCLNHNTHVQHKGLARRQHENFWRVTSQSIKFEKLVLMPEELFQSSKISGQ